MIGGRCRGASTLMSFMAPLEQLSSKRLFWSTTQSTSSCMSSIADLQIYRTQARRRPTTKASKLRAVIPCVYIDVNICYTHMFGGLSGWVFPLPILPAHNTSTPAGLCRLLHKFSSLSCGLALATIYVGCVTCLNTPSGLFNVTS